MIIVSRYQASRIETIGMQGGLPLPPTDTYKTFKAADVRNAGDARRHYEINDGMIYVFSVIVYEADKRVRCRMNC